MPNPVLFLLNSAAEHVVKFLNVSIVFNPSFVFMFHCGMFNHFRNKT